MTRRHVQEPPRFFEALAELKEELDLNIELASPDDFIPEVPHWRERCLFHREAQASGLLITIHSGAA